MTKTALKSSLRFHILLFAGILFLTACGGDSNGQSADTGENGEGSGNVSGNVVINGKVTNCRGDSIYVFKMVGTTAQKIVGAKLNGSGNEKSFSVGLDISDEALYKIGDDPKMAAEVILGKESPLEYSANCYDAANTAKISPSPINDAYQNFMREMVNSHQKLQGYMQTLQMYAKTNPGGMGQIQQQMQQEQAKRMKLIEDHIGRNDVMAKIAPLYYFTPFSKSGKVSKYDNEQIYFLNEFLGEIDVNSPAALSIAQFQNRFGEFVNSMSQRKMSNDSIQRHLQIAFDRVDKGSDARKVMMRGAIAGAGQAKSDLYIPLAEQYLKEFPNDKGYTAALQGELSRRMKMAPGALPPEIALNTPSGVPLTLSSLKGNVVLVDFWASWCRPCRMENPNVVRMYNKYHGSGFEILGVSLDNDANRWKQAIQADGLTWKHVSDLKGWRSVAAKDYGVSSIPMTFLLDKEGKIIAKNLRGPALESKLAELFGF